MSRHLDLKALCFLWEHELLQGPWLHRFINKLWLSETVPSNWNEAALLILFKKGASEYALITAALA